MNLNNTLNNINYDVNKIISTSLAPIIEELTNAKEQYDILNNILKQLPLYKDLKFENDELKLKLRSVQNVKTIQNIKINDTIINNKAPGHMSWELEERDITLNIEEINKTKNTYKNDKVKEESIEDESIEDESVEDESIENESIENESIENESIEGENKNEKKIKQITINKKRYYTDNEINGNLYKSKRNLIIIGKIKNKIPILYN